MENPKYTLRRWLYEHNERLLREFYATCEEINEGELPRTLLETAAAELLESLRLLVRAVEEGSDAAITMHAGYASTLVKRLTKKEIRSEKER